MKRRPRDDSTSDLRRRAEALVRKSKARAARPASAGGATLAHELQVHQAELEMQNDELRRTQLNLEASLARLAELFDFAPVGFLTLDPEGLVIEANLTAAALLGGMRGDIVRRKLSQFIAASSQDAYYLHRQKVFVTETPQSCELLLRRVDGRTVPAELRSIAIASLPGGQLQCLSVLSDVTLRHQLEETRREHEQAQTLVDFFAAAPVGLLLVGATGQVERINSAQLRMLGCAPAQALNRSVADWFVEPEPAAELLRQLQAKKTVRNFRARLRHANGSTLQVLIDANGLWQGTTLRHSRWFVRDITERVELEHEVVRIAENEQQRFGRDLHDDLCQQLTGIEFLGEQLAGLPALREKGAQAAIRKITALLRDAIDYTREMARGLSPVQSEERGLTYALRELARRTRTMSRVDCRFRCDSPVSLSNPASSHLYRIAQEAVTNSVRHGRARRIEINLAETGRGLELKIRDNGIGLPRTPGVRRGAGMKIMHYRADAVGGTLEVRRRPRAGTEVTCIVPAASP